MKHQIATTPEQSRRLIACGVGHKTADMCWTQRTHRIDGSPIKKSRQKANLWLGYPCRRVLEDDEQRIDTPAWSLSALLPLLPKRLEEKYWLTIQRTNELSSDFAYGLAYMRCDYDDYDDPENWQTHSVGKKCVTHSINPIEAVVQAIEWLTQNGYSLNIL